MGGENDIESKSKEELSVELKRAEVIKKLESIPYKNVYCLFVDGALMGRGKESSWWGYDVRETGSIHSLFCAYNFVLSDDFFKKELTTATFLEIFKRIASHRFDPIYYSSDKNNKAVLLPDFRKGNVVLPCITKRVSIDGLRQLFAWLSENKDSKMKITAYDKEYDAHNAGSITDEEVKKLHKQILVGSGAQVLLFNGEEDTKIENKLNSVIRDFNTDIENAKFDSKKIIKAIILLCHRAELIHPFGDCNLRTMNCLLFGLCVKYGIMPPTFYRPEILNFFSIEQQEKEFSNGQKTTEELVGQKDEINYNSYNPSSEKVEKYSVDLKVQPPKVPYNDYQLLYDFYASSGFSKNKPEQDQAKESLHKFYISEISSRFNDGHNMLDLALELFKKMKLLFDRKISNFTTYEMPSWLATLDGMLQNLRFSDEIKASTKSKILGMGVGWGIKAIKRFLDTKNKRENELLRMFYKEVIFKPPLKKKMFKGPKHTKDEGIKYGSHGK